MVRSSNLKARVIRPWRLQHSCRYSRIFFMDIYYSGVGLLFHDDVATPMIKSTPAVIFNSGLACSVRGYFFPRLKCIQEGSRSIVKKYPLLSHLMAAFFIKCIDEDKLELYRGQYFFLNYKCNQEKPATGKGKYPFLPFPFFYNL